MAKAEGKIPEKSKSVKAKPDDAHLQEVNQEIYKRNLELAVVNKTLSLLRKLYQISLLTLDSPVLAEKISDTVREDLNLETVGVFVFNHDADTLTPYQFSKSSRLTAVLNKIGYVFATEKITNVFKSTVLKHVVYDKQHALTTRLNDVWEEVGDHHKLSEVSAEAHIKTILLYPLITEDKVIGVLFLAMNRNYETATDHEKDAIKSLVDVVAVALDKAFLYEQLRDANERLKVLDRARSEFITIASHQLRTPPATIKWYLASIISGDFGELPEKVKEQLQKTEWTNNGLIATIDDLLNVSRIERGKMEFNFNPTDILALTQGMVEQLTPQAINKKLKLVFNKPTFDIPKILADKEKLGQVINNLIDNAIKYTREGIITVNLECDHDNIMLKVTDTGRGVKLGMLESVFDKFDRGKEMPKNSTGLGLGLYVAKVIIGQHNGKIWAESEGEGKGSTFIFTIPIKNNLVKSEFDLTKGL